MLSAIVFPLILSLPNLVKGEEPKEGIQFTPYKDSKCTEPMKMKQGDEEIKDLRIKYAITDWDKAGGTYYENMTFPDSNTVGSKLGQGSNVVYWKVPEPEAACSFQLMVDTELGWQTATYLPGNIILQTKGEGCYYSAIEGNKDLITSYCCGSGQCGAADMATHQFIKKDEIIEAPEQVKRSIVDEIDQRSVAEHRSPLSHASYASRVVDRKRELLTRDDREKIEDRKCTMLPTKDPLIYTTAGPQKKVANPQTCNGDTACSFTVNVNQFYSTSTTTSQSSTWTVGGGAEVSMKAGINFFVDAEASVSFSVNIAKTWGEETSKQVGETKMTGVSQQVTQAVGTTGFLSFVPIYECEQRDYNCGKDDKDQDILIPSVDVCNPMKDGDLISGSYVMVYM